VADHMARVVVVRTAPHSIIDDVGRAVSLAEFEDIAPPSEDLVIKLNLSWTKFYPASSTSVWTFDAVLHCLRERGYRRERIFPVENGTVVTDPREGVDLNKWNIVLENYGLEFLPLTEVPWVEVNPKIELPALRQIFGAVRIPEILIGKNVLHLPTVKTHGHSVFTGSMKNAFGSFITEVRHRAHLRIHEVLVDLLAIQREFCKGVFSVTDGSVIGDGAGPRTMVLKEGNILMASADMVASDAVQTWMMFRKDPFEIPSLEIAHEKGLGVADLAQIEILGDFHNVESLPFLDMKAKMSPVIAADRFFRSSVANDLLFHTPLFNLCIFASAVYHDALWYNLFGRSRIRSFLKTGWGQLFQGY